MSDDPAAQAHALVRASLRAPARLPRRGPPARGGAHGPGAGQRPAERLLYFALVGALEAGLVRTAEDTLTVLRQASAPLGPMGVAWLAQQERGLDQA